MIAWVELEQVVDNPYQTRQVYDEAGVRELAADIWGMREVRPETGGLIQVPLVERKFLPGGVEAALNRVREILEGRDEEGLMGELGEVERLVEEFSQEKGGD